MFGQACRICGCTEDDCRQCYEKTGGPCHWVEEDLCSACVDDQLNASVRCEFKDGSGREQLATFDTWLTPGKELEELEPLCELMLDSLGMKDVTITKTEFKET